MLSNTHTDRIADTIKSAAASTEARFLDLGNHLGAAIDVLGKLTQTFDLLSSELQGSNLSEATQTLDLIKSRIAAVGDAPLSERDAITQLATLTVKLQQRVTLMEKAVGGIKMLAVNARIEAASIGEVGLDFIDFANEIGRTLRLAQISLEHLTHELSRIGNDLRGAAISQANLARVQSAAVLSIPVRLETSIGAIKDRGRRAVAAASAVTQKTRQVGHRISSAVAALQIGDTTRQRLEHVEYALRLADEILASGRGAAPAGPSDWASLTDAQRRDLATLCWRLEAAQLVDTADEFEHEVRRITASIQDLARDAQDILGLGTTAAGASNDRGGTFVGEVEDQVAEVGGLLDGLERAKQEADHVAASVSSATTRLVDHTGTLKFLEGDIRIMGLNTSLKCGRLGTVGRPLMVIAQELRAYANQIASDANAVAINLDKMIQVAGSLSGDSQRDNALDAAGVGVMMTDCVARLESTGESLANALVTLAQDTDGVSTLLLNTVARTSHHEELGSVLRQAAADLMTAVADAGGSDAGATAEADRLLDLIVRSYTMDRERKVYSQSSNGRPIPLTTNAPTIGSAGAPDLDDPFF